MVKVLFGTFVSMFRYFGFFICVGISSSLSSQALNTDFRSNWDDNTLLSQSGVVFNDLWGYADRHGREYAIVGSRRFTHFIDVTDPDNPIEVDRDNAGGNCLWRDYKTYRHYAYGVSEFCNGGIEIFDLSTLPDSAHKVYDSGEFNVNAHNVFIDTAKGKLYATGVTSGLADIVVLDLTQDPTRPSLIKNLSLPDYGYVHDLYVRNDTAYCSHGSARRLVIYDFSDLDSGPEIIGEFSTTGYNHSNWVTDDGNTLVVADETFDNPVILADISNKETPQMISSFQSTLLGPNNSIAHNPYIIGNDFVVLSYYDDGLQIYKIDSTDNPFLAGYYDTDTLGQSYQSDGAWGAYPYLPSGNLLASDIQHGLFVITPQFPLRDCQSIVNIRGTYDNHWDIISQDHISTSAAYNDNAEVVYRAPQYLDLHPGFSISKGSMFDLLLVDQCQSVSSKKPSRRKDK